MANDRMFPCFPIPIAIYNFQEETHEMNIRLMNDIYTEMKINKDGIIGSNVGGWHSDNNMDTKYSSFRSLRNIIDKSINDYCNKYGFASGHKSQGLWANVNRENEYNMPHHHGESAMTGVYYPVKQVTNGLYEFNYSKNVSLQAGTYDGENGGSLTIQDPSYGLKTKMVKKPEYQPFTIDHYHYYPVSGTLVLIPSYLIHSVLPFQGKGERVSISFCCLYEES